MVSLEDIKLPPHNLDAEKWTLSGIFLENEMAYVYDAIVLQAEDFYQREHALIYAAMKWLWNGRKTIDVVTLANQLERDGVLDAIWGNDYLYELSTFLLSTSSCPEYAKIVKEKSVLRGILKVSQNIIGDVYEQKDTMEVLNTIEKRIFDLTQTSTADSVRHIGDLLNTRIEDYMDIVDNPDKIFENRVFSWFYYLDDMLSGFKPWELIILAARPAMGKTAFALNMLKNIAIDQKKSVAMFSLEMAAESLVDRIVSIVSSIPMYKISKGKLEAEDFSDIGEAIELLGDSNIYLDDKDIATVPALRSKLRRLKIEKWSLDLVIVDYLQLMQGTIFIGNKVQEVSEISRGLKQLAMELQIPIVALSQLSRAVESRIDKKPQLSDLRDSWSIEQDADAVIMLHREDYYDPDTDKKGACDICLRKNRNGAVGEIELHFEAPIMKFSRKETSSDGSDR